MKTLAVFLMTAVLGLPWTMAQERAATVEQAGPTIDHTPATERFAFNDFTGSRRTFSHLAEMPNLIGAPRDVYKLLRFESVQRDLEFFDHQAADLKQIKMDRRHRQREMMDQLQGELNAADVQDLGQRFTAKAEALESEMQQIQMDSQARIRESLMPVQQKRLQQIALQLRIKSRGIVEVLNDPQFQETLEITPEQFDELQQRAVEHSREYDDQVRKLRGKIQRDLLQVLDGDQQQQLKNMLGEKFKLIPTLPTDENE